MCVVSVCVCERERYREFDKECETLKERVLKWGKERQVSVFVCMRERDF